MTGCLRSTCRVAAECSQMTACARLIRSTGIKWLSRYRYTPITCFGSLQLCNYYGQNARHLSAIASTCKHCIPKDASCVSRKKALSTNPVLHTVGTSASTYHGRFTAVAMVKIELEGKQNRYYVFALNLLSLAPLATRNLDSWIGTWLSIFSDLAA